MSLEAAIARLRPALHRYCARMTGSVIDGEDALQDALTKAVAAFDTTIENPEGWLFRIAHNAALDLLRRRARDTGEELDDMEDPAESHALATRAALRTFIQLPVAQRQVVILMDVLGYSLDDICAMTDRSLSSVKAALHRGRESLRALVAAEKPVRLDAPTDARLLAYIDRFNARDFDAVRDMLAEDVRLDLVSRVKLNGKREVQTYFSNYATKTDWRLEPGYIDDVPVALVRDLGEVVYFVALDWRDDKLVAVRDFRYARYVMGEAPPP